VTDLYTPWRGPLEVDWREVDLNEALSRSMDELSDGGVPLHLYVYGGWGSGKTHLLASLEQGWRTRAGLELVVVRDGEVPRSSPEWLLERLGSEGRRVALIDRIDLHLAALDPKARWTLRRALQQQKGLWLIGTGAAVDGALFGREEAFYQFFDAWNMPVPDDAWARWLGGGLPRNGAAHAALAGPIPRNLRALAIAPGETVPERLQSALQWLTPDHWSRLRALAHRAQQIVSVVAGSPRPVQPTELAERLSLSTATVAVTCGRLVDERILEKTRRGREAYYTLRDDLWRHGLRLATERWEESSLADVAEWVSLAADTPQKVGEAELSAAMRSADFGEVRRVAECCADPPMNPTPCRTLPAQVALFPRASRAFWKTEAGASWAASFASLEDTEFARRLSELSGVVRAPLTPAGTLALATLARRRPGRFAALAQEAETPLVTHARALAELLASTPLHREFAFLESRIREEEAGLRWRVFDEDGPSEAQNVPANNASSG
jgi:DNA-binding MarR family transcriptional regulator